MAYTYTNDDMFYDVESLTNVFSVAFWLPKLNAIILSYLEDDHIIKNQDDLTFIKEHIYKLHPNLKKNNTKIVFENIANTGYIKEFNKENPSMGILGMQSFAKRFGLANELTQLNASINDRRKEAGGLQYDEAFYPVKNTDPDYEPDIHGFRFGYNSTNYDVTILAHLFEKINDQYFRPDFANRPILIGGKNPITAEELRDFNDELFSDEWRSKMSMRLSYDEFLPPGSFGNFKKPGWIFRKAWLNTGRYIDVARLNEKQQRVGLKRLLGMLGLQIMESDKLTINTRLKNIEEMADLLAYNIADVVNLQKLFEHKVYQNAFQVRGNLLETYPQTVYDKKKGENITDNKNYQNVRRNRLAQDSTSAKFVEYALAPYDAIKDMPVVDFKYPSKQEAKKLNIEQTDVLEDSKKFFEENISNDPNCTSHQEFMEVYNFYQSIKGINYNNSKAYLEQYGDYGSLPDHLWPKDHKYMREQMGKFNTNLFYYHKDKNGSPYRSTCLANFSVGGIHGAEVHMEKYNEDYTTYKTEKTIQDYVESLYDSALEAINGEIRIAIPEHITIPERLKPRLNKEGHLKIREFIKGGSTKKKADWRVIPKISLFEYKNGNWKVRDRYNYVSVGKSHHEDFTSYYPLLLSRLSVFINPDFHGYGDDGQPRDPYYEMFLERVAKKKESRDQTLSEKIRELADMEQDARKLLINTASGAGDANFENNILVNNSIISMRIIGQLFAWRIGQAQALAGARVPSTNTDGLYTMDISAEENDTILEEIASDMHIGIEPERLDRFISKDSNNRLEVYKGKIVSAKGGTLKSWVGPEPTEALDHPAITDWVLVHYLADPSIKDPTNVPFDPERARALFHRFIKEKIEEDNHPEILRFFQWIVASSLGTHRYNYLKYINKHTGDEKIQNIQQYNRLFLTKDNDQNYRTEMYLATRAVVAIKKWEANIDLYAKGELMLSELWVHDEDGLEILKQNGLDLKVENKKESSEHYRDEAKTQKIRGMPQNQNINIYNNSLYDLSKKEIMEMINQLDLDAYLELVENTFKTWSNL